MNPRYSLEIYEGGSHPTAAFASDSPFGAIAVGDEINRIGLGEGGTLGDGANLRVTRIKHVIWTEPKSGQTRHKILVETEMIQE